MFNNPVTLIPRNQNTSDDASSNTQTEEKIELPEHRRQPEEDHDPSDDPTGKNEVLLVLYIKERAVLLNYCTHTALTHYKGGVHTPEPVYEYH